MLVDLSAKPNNRSRWSSDDYSKIAAMLSGGRTIPEIAKAVGRSQEAVINRAAKSGLVKPRSRR